MLDVRLLIHVSSESLLNKESPKGIHPFISHISEAPSTSASGQIGAKAPTIALLLLPSYVLL